MGMLWNNSSLTSFKGANHTNVWVPPVIKNIEFSLYKINTDEVGRLDLVSYKVYGSEQYFWVIAHFNNLLDPVIGFSIGDKLRIPNLSQYLQKWKSAGL